MRWAEAAIAERPAKAPRQGPAAPPPPTPPLWTATGSESKGREMWHTNNNEVELEFKPRSINPVPKWMLLAEPVGLERRSINPVAKSQSMGQTKEWTARLAVLLKERPTPVGSALPDAREQLEQPLRTIVVQKDREQDRKRRQRGHTRQACLGGTFSFIKIVLP